MSFLVPAAGRRGPGHNLGAGGPGLDEFREERVCPLAAGPAGGTAAAAGNGLYAAIPDALHDADLQHSKETDRILHLVACPPAPTQHSSHSTAAHGSHVLVARPLLSLLVAALEIGWNGAQKLVRAFLLTHHSHHTDKANSKTFGP